jgi:hypothetical protein
MVVVVDLAIALSAVQGITHFRSAENVARPRALRRLATAVGGIGVVVMFARRLPDAFVVGSVRNVSDEQVLASLYGRLAFDPA